VGCIYVCIIDTDGPSHPGDTCTGSRCCNAMTECLSTTRVIALQCHEVPVRPGLHGLLLVLLPACDGHWPSSWPSHRKKETLPAAAVALRTAQFDKMKLSDEPRVIDTLRHFGHILIAGTDEARATFHDLLCRAQCYHHGHIAHDEDHPYCT